MLIKIRFEFIRFFKLKFTVFEVGRQTGSMLSRNALWDSFEDALTFFIGYYKVAPETGVKISVPKQPHRAIQQSIDLVSL